MTAIVSRTSLYFVILVNHDGVYSKSRRLLRKIAQGGKSRDALPV
jgi:hypothetical protein